MLRLDGEQPQLQRCEMLRSGQDMQQQRPEQANHLRVKRIWSRFFLGHEGNKKVSVNLAR